MFSILFEYLSPNAENVEESDILVDQFDPVDFFAFFECGTIIRKGKEYLTLK
jgi:hypothetical protein